MATNEGQSEAGADDKVGRQRRAARQLTDKEGAERGRHHLQKSQEAGGGAGNARVEAEPRGNAGRLAEPVADPRERHRHEQRRGRQRDEERPQNQHCPGSQRQINAAEKQPRAAEAQGKSGRSTAAEHVSGHWQENHPPV
jgi:hypothetical protein